MSTIFPASVRRVTSSTSRRVNDSIHAETRARIDRYSRRLDEIEERLNQLDREWDTERTLETNAAALTLTGLALGAFVDRRWLLLSGTVAAFLLQHGLQGWCPPLPILRRMGFRTPREIETERYALKALRGDFESAEKSPSNAIAATRGF